MLKRWASRPAEGVSYVKLSFAVFVREWRYTVTEKISHVMLQLSKNEVDLGRVSV
jgi:hypothetical protein